ncbi:hypothetical protein Tco_1326609 [Tanacetum coccineum]
MLSYFMTKVRSIHPWNINHLKGERDIMEGSPPASLNIQSPDLRPMEELLQTPIDGVRDAIVGALPSNTQPKPMSGELIRYTTKEGGSGKRTKGETLMDEVHITSPASTAHVPPPGIQTVSPPKPKEDPKPNPYQPKIPYPSSLDKSKHLDINNVQVSKGSRSRLACGEEGGVCEVAAKGVDRFDGLTLGGVLFKWVNEPNVLGVWLVIRPGVRGVGLSIAKMVAGVLGISKENGSGKWENNRILEEILRTLEANSPVDVKEPEGSDDYTEVTYDKEQCLSDHYTAPVTPPAYIPSIPFLATMEPADTLLMGDEVISTIPAWETDEFIKSSVDDLVLILREYEVTSDNDLECDIPTTTLVPTTDVREENFDINSPLGEYVVDFLMENEDVAGLPRHLVKQLFRHLLKNPSLTKGMFDEPLGDDTKSTSYDVTFSNPLFYFNDDFTLCNDNSLFDEEFEDISSLDPPKSTLVIDESSLLVIPLLDPNQIQENKKRRDEHAEIISSTKNPVSGSRAEASQRRRNLITQASKT